MFNLSRMAIRHLQPDDQLSVADVTRVLGVSEKTVRRYEADGKLKATRTPGGHRRFRRSDVEALRDGIPAATLLGETASA